MKAAYFYQALLPWCVVGTKILKEQWVQLAFHFRVVSGQSTYTPLVFLFLLFQTNNLSVLSSWLSTIFSSSETSIGLSVEGESPSNPTMKSKKGSMSEKEAGEDGVTRRTCRPCVGDWDWDVDWRAPILIVWWHLDSGESRRVIMTYAEFGQCHFLCYSNNERL